MYERIKDMQKQIEDKEKGILRLEKDRGSFNAGSVTEKALKNVLEKTIARIEGAPKEKQREIFENVIQFAEFYPEGRIRLGVYSESDSKEPKRQKKTARAAIGSSGAEVYSIFGDQSFVGAKSSPTIKNGGEGEIRTHGTFWVHTLSKRAP